MDFSFTRDIKKKGGGIASSILTAGKHLLKKIPVGSVINSAIDSLPVELHIPGGYQYCGPGTKLEERLKRGDPGINKLDQACKEHDIAYSKYSDTSQRAVADQTLAKRAWERVSAKDSSLSEKASALAVATAMKAKTSIGGCIKRKCRRKSTVKRGGKIKNKKKLKKKRQSSKKSIWSMIKSGKGLYLRPHRSVY